MKLPQTIDGLPTTVLNALRFILQLIKEPFPLMTGDGDLAVTEGGNIGITDWLEIYLANFRPDSKPLEGFGGLEHAFIHGEAVTLTPEDVEVIYLSLVRLSGLEEMALKRDWEGIGTWCPIQEEAPAVPHVSSGPATPDAPEREWACNRCMYSWDGHGGWCPSCGCEATHGRAFKSAS